MNDKAQDHAVAYRFLDTLSRILHAKHTKLVEEAREARQALDVSPELQHYVELSKACYERDVMFGALNAIAELTSRDVVAQWNAIGGRDDRFLDTLSRIWRAKCTKLMEEADKARKNYYESGEHHYFKEWSKACYERDVIVDSLNALAELTSRDVDAELNAIAEKEGEKA